MSSGVVKPECGEGGGVVLFDGAWDEGEAGLLEEFEAEVAAFGPFVVLLASTAPTSRMIDSPWGKMPTTSVRRISLLWRSFGVVGPGLAPHASGEPVKARTSSPAASRCS